MSQSDYIKYKRVSNMLKNMETNPVLSEQNYIDYKQYSIENSIYDNSKNYLNLLEPSGVNNIFNMNKKVSNCPTYPVCIKTNARSNRVALSSVYFTPKYLPQYIKNKPLNNTICNCITNGKYSNSVYMNTKKCLCATTY